MPSITRGIHVSVYNGSVAPRTSSISTTIISAPTLKPHSRVFTVLNISWFIKHILWYESHLYIHFTFTDKYINLYNLQL